MAILYAMIILWISAGLGRTLLGKLAVLDESAALRFAYSGAIGLGIAAYSVLLIGLCGLLSYWPITFLWFGMACAGYRGILRNSRDLAAFVRQILSDLPKLSVRHSGSLVALASGVTLVLFAAAAIITCFKPPAGLEWDAISYHLADPAQFLIDHRVFSIPTEHHSNFPLLMEMLYTVALLYKSYALANLIHLLTGILTILAIFACARRLHGSTCGWIAVLLFASTPVVFWESSVAYVEMGLGLLTTLAVLAAVRAIAAPGQTSEQRKQWLLLCALCAGFALGVKYLAVIPFGLIALYVAVKSRSLRRTAVFVAVALAIGSPWYIKNAVLLHNPVYPFFYKVFPGSVNWTTGRAAGYEAEQARFGTPHALKKQPAEALSNLMQVPWDLVTLPLAKSGAYSNEGEFTFMTLVGGLIFAFNALLLLRKRVNPEVVAIIMFGAVQIAAWFFVAQVSRYLVSVLPLLAISGACGVVGIIEESGSRLNKRSRIFSYATATIACLLLAVQIITILWLVVAAPPFASIVTLPQIAEILESPNGVNDYLRRRLDTFAVTDWINKNTPKNAGVLLYDDTRGFYIDRPYMWANEAHSGYIPYAAFKDGKDLTEWMVDHNYRYAMFDMNWAPQARTDPNLPNGPRNNEAEAFQRWYASAPLEPVGFAGYRWRGLVADAFRRGLWTDMGHAQNGVMLLHIGTENTVGETDISRVHAEGDAR